MNKRRLPILLLVLCALLPAFGLALAGAGPGPAVAQEPVWKTVVFRQGLNGYQGAIDTFIDEFKPTTNHEGNDYVLIRQEDTSATLLRFDVSSIPEGSTVLSATLSLQIRSRNREGLPLNVELYDVLRPWTPGEVTWQQASAGVPWAQAGCNDVYVDRMGVPVAEAILDRDEGAVPFDVTASVQSWVSNPEENHGLVLKSFDVRWPVQYLFWSSEFQIAHHYRPQLEIIYSEPLPTPTPTRSPTATATSTPTATATPTETPIVQSWGVWLPIVRRDALPR